MIKNKIYKEHSDQSIYYPSVSRRLHGLITLLLIFSLNKCVWSKEIKSIHPLYSEASAFIYSELQGVWLSSFGDSVIIKQAGDNFYLLELKEKTGTSYFELVVVTLGADNNRQKIIDIYPRTMTGENPFYRDHFQKTHSFFKIDVKNDSLIVFPLNYNWFHKSATKNNILNQFIWTLDGMLLTSATDKLVDFFKAHQFEQGFFSDSLIYKNIPGQLKKVNPNAKIAMTKTFQKGFPDTHEFFYSSEYPDCLPSFPNKDGWLGGDGTISVALDSTQVVWFFADSFVGNRQQHNRSGTNMVSNSMAISSCDVTNGWDLRYYWRDMYSDNPGDFFETYTDRYCYWPQDAFMHNGNIYVALNKVSPTYGADPGIGFENIGATLAKISNFKEVEPSQWQINYIPWSSVIQYHSWKGIATHGNHIYMFTQLPEKLPFLTRIPIDHIDEPARYIEYWSKQHIWKKGMNEEDAQVILDERISGSGGSVRYHADLNQWVLIYGPRWNGRKILKHTAPELTGPWSKGESIYEVPEIIPENRQYDKDNFCYFAREQIPFYNTKNKKFMITYDCNSDFGKVIDNLDIYFPRIIYVPATESR